MTVVATRLLDPRADFFTHTYCIGQVEIRNCERDTLLETEALTMSGEAFRISELHRCMRLVTVVNASGIEEVDSIAGERFEEALDALSSECLGIAPMMVLDVGFYRHIPGGNVAPRLPDTALNPFALFRVDHALFPQCDWPQLLIASRPCELQSCILRSYHWSRKADLEFNVQMRVLFRWFAMEAIWMLTRDDDIVPRIMWSLGFPTGPGARLLSTGFTTSLNADSRVGHWRQRIERQLGDIKTFRNNTVHNGFRPQDTPKGTMRAFDKLASAACLRVQKQAASGLRNGLVNPKELFEYLPVLVEQDTQYVVDIHERVLDTFETI